MRSCPVANRASGDPNATAWYRAQVTAFDPATNPVEDLAFELLSFSPVTLFLSRQVLGEAVARLSSDGYQVVEFGASAWDDRSMREDLSNALAFPYVAPNIDALNDLLYDVVDQEWGWDPLATGLILVFTGFDAFARADARTAWILLDIVANRSRSASLIGRRLLCLVQTDDPDIRLEPVGASPAWWNRAEWLRSNREAGHND